MAIGATTGLVLLATLCFVAPYANSSGAATGVAEATAVSAFSTAPVPITFWALGSIDGSRPLVFPKIDAAQDAEQRLVLPRMDDIGSSLYTSDLMQAAVSPVSKNDKIPSSKSRSLQVDTRCVTRFNVTGHTTSNYTVYSTDIVRQDTSLPADSDCATASSKNNTSDLSASNASTNLILISSSAAPSGAKKNLVIVVNFN